jgi:hypothetical protein
MRLCLGVGCFTPSSFLRGAAFCFPKDTLHLAKVPPPFGRFRQQTLFHGSHDRRSSRSNDSLSWFGSLGNLRPRQTVNRGRMSTVGWSDPAKERPRCMFAAAGPGSRSSVEVTLEAVADIRERRGQPGADSRCTRDDRDGDQSGDQAVFDSRRTPFIAAQTLKKLHHRKSLLPSRRGVSSGRCCRRIESP